MLELCWGSRSCAFKSVFLYIRYKEDFFWLCYGLGLRLDIV
jgi:hypothetical protein